MKKGFTMIELIFVIVILGILASVAVPRLAGTKADAEESAAVANLRTLVSDLNTYYVAKGDFPDETTWSQITNVPLKDATKGAVGDNATANLTVGGEDCIGVNVKTEGDTTYIKFTKKESATGVCSKVLKAKSVDAYLKSKVAGVTGEGAMPIGSSIKLKR